MMTKDFANQYGGSYLCVKYSELIERSVNNNDENDEIDNEKEAKNIINRIKDKLRKLGGG